MTEIAAPKWLVQRHGLAPLAARSGDASYRDALVQATLDWARIEQDLSPIARAMAENGVRVAPIKGAAYARSLYSAPAERPMADIDLLIVPGSEARARAVLREHGYTPGASAVMHHAETWVRAETVIDLHWSIIAPGRGHIDLAAVWSRTSPGWLPGAVQLDAADALVFHLVHLARNRLLLPLINVVDTARLLERIDDPRIALARARAWGLGFAASIALRFCTAILDGEDRRPGGWLGPSRAEIVDLEETDRVRKVVFEVALAGTPGQLAARAIGFGANKLRELKRQR